MHKDVDELMAAVGPRLRALRQQEKATLAELASATGISVSTLSRLESGGRRPNLELLLPLAEFHGVPLDELIGYEWLYVLNGTLRVILGEHDMMLKPGEAAEFDTRTPHWFRQVGAEPVEFLCLFSRQGERIHVRARPSKV